MYSPDQTDIDPRNPANWREPKLRYEVLAVWSRGNAWLGDFDDEDVAKAAALNLETWRGKEVFVRQIDIETGDEECILSAEWDDEILGGRYVC